MITGIDIVQMQIRVAAGEKLPFKQKDLAAARTRDRVPDQRRGSRTRSCRRPDESPAITRPAGPGIRVDSHAYHNYFVPPNYDSMIGKVIAYGDTRDQAIARMRDRAFGDGRRGHQDQHSAAPGADDGRGVPSRRHVDPLSRAEAPEAIGRLAWVSACADRCWQTSRMPGPTRCSRPGRYRSTCTMRPQARRMRSRSSASPARCSPAPGTATWSPRCSTLAATSARSSMRSPTAMEIAAPAVELSTVEEQDWVRLTQSQFEPIRISSRMWILPSWHEASRSQCNQPRHRSGPCIRHR